MIAKKQSASVVLGLAFDGKRVRGAVVRRNGGVPEVQKSFAGELSETPVSGSPQTLGGELRALLQQHGVKEQRCVVALPLEWVLSLQTKVPALSEADLPGFLAIEAERSFAYDPESLFVSSALCRLPSGDQYANIAGVQREQVLNLQSVLAAARLKPLSFTLGISAVQRMLGESKPLLLLLPRNDGLEVGITSGDELLSMRSLESAEAGSDADAIGRELRVTLGQLPNDFRGQLVDGRVIGTREQAQQLGTALAPRLRSLGVELTAPDLSSVHAPPDAPVRAMAAAAGHLSGRRSSFEFLPPKVSAWKEFAGKASSRKLAWAAGIAGGIFVLFLLSFFVQGWRLSKLQARWGTMAPRVTDLEAMQQQIKKFRPWFDNSYRTMTILRKITEAFPEEGAVTAKSLEIRNGNLVTCSGTARDEKVFFTMLDQLRSSKQVADVKYDQIRGKKPLQFSFNFRWVEGGTGEH